MKPLANVLSEAGREVAGGDKGGDLTIVQCKTIKKCQNKSYLCNEYMLIK
jgi:hypothetical protein